MSDNELCFLFWFQVDISCHNLHFCHTKTDTTYPMEMLVSQEWITTFNSYLQIWNNKSWAISDSAPIHLRSGSNQHIDHSAFIQKSKHWQVLAHYLWKIGLFIATKNVFYVNKIENSTIYIFSRICECTCPIYFSNESPPGARYA